MAKTKYLLAGAVTAAVLLSAAPGQAAWWDFGRNAPVSGRNDVQLAQAAGDAERMSRIEAQMRTLTGQIEQLTHSLGELQAQLKRMQDDNEFRFKSLESAATASPAKGPAPAKQTAVTPPPAVAPAPPAASVAAAPPAAGGGTDAIGALAAASSAPQPQPGTAGPGAPPRSLGTVPVAPPAVGAIPAQQAPADQPLDLSALAKGGVVADAPPPQQPMPAPQATLAPQAVPGPQVAPAPQALPADQKAVASIAPSGDPQVDYKRAYEQFVGGQYAASEASFRQFLASYPNDDRASDATYWLGQTLYSRGMYREAALEFVNGHKLYPKSLRAADTMLLLGKSLAGIPEREAACQTFAAALKQYPQMAPSLKSRVVSEQANAGC